MKKQTYNLWAVENETEYLAFTSWDVRPLLFGLESTAKKHLRVGDADDPVLVRVTIEPIKKPKRARKRPSKWTVRMGKPVYAAKRARGKK